MHGPNRRVSKKRNTKRGIRSEIKKLERNMKRSIKRNKARKLTRAKKQKGANGPGWAQEPNQQKPEEKKNKTTRGCGPSLKWEYNKEINIGTLNCWGLMKAGKREAIEYYMKQRKIHILALQETHINNTCREQRKHYTFFFSGDPQRKKRTEK